MAYASMENAIILKGTRHGLLASVREDADWRDVLRELTNIRTLGATQTTASQEFLKDAQLVLDFGWREVSEEQFDSVLVVLKGQDLGCSGILSTSLNTRTIAESRGYRAIIGRLGLAQHQGRRLRRDQEAAPQATPVSPLPLAEAEQPEEAPHIDELSPPVQPEQVVEPLPQAPARVPSLASLVIEAEAVPTIYTPLTVVPNPPAAPLMQAEPSVEESIESDEASIEDGPTSAFDSADPIVANLPVVFDSSELDGPRAFSSSHEPGIHIPHYQDEEPTLYIRKTLRSGQRVVFAGNVVLLGDLNPGAQIEADGDVIVLGQLRGSVHAGCEGDHEATVVTSSLRATQLRIADRFYKADPGSRFFRKTPPSGTLRARLDGDTVVVEALPVR